ncbi:long-chain fatty-acid--CoA ligase [Corynebacterium sp. TAE3-ERU12]|uniref:long-chain fatty-acid--CoA ligase n=1 Tax=Corynebacterium sp. TAE3-ERU12 TaxID=2849491 RepID=UPI001C45A69B|nr:long-chain fatty-acid--CoA ligase [Corynebacterium sp. TAE3-ERU12]MBV7295099.1 long-chain fatty-acid--CoA ligase [Corynebacterium sp. TAE3-ERU12]
MHSTMQQVPLSVARIVEYGRTIHANTPVTTWTDDGPEETTFDTIGARAAALAHALRDDLGIDGDQRVGTLMHNCAEHLETFFAVASMGAVFQPLNRQLMPDQIVHIINHAHDEVIIADPRLAELLGKMLPDCPHVRAVVFIGLTEVEAATRHIPDSVECYSYEGLIDGKPTKFDWPVVDENDAAALCYSTGTTGAPKGVAYSHRSMYLHTLNLRTPDALAITHGEAWLACVPIYHVLCWGVPLACFACGAPIVFPDADMSPQRLADIIATSSPRAAIGVPTVWISLIVHYLNNPPERMSLQEIFVGGSPAPPRLIRLWEQHYGIDVIHAWGMTETSPLGTVARPPRGASGEARESYRFSQGRFGDLLEFRIVDEEGRQLGLHDRNQGELQVRGNTVTARYFHSEEEDEGGDAHIFRGNEVEDGADMFTDDGWLRTGDVGSITRDGYLNVQDRARDVIRSGGEWIYSAQLENLVMASQKVVECAVIGMPDKKWGERPLAVTVLIDGVEPNAETATKLRDFLAPKLPKWMLPEYWAFVDSIDKTSVQKFDKKDLRKHLADGDFDIVCLPGPGSNPTAAGAGEVGRGGAAAGPAPH